ncbi:hypothetical protein DUI87_00628 [Hirundo rustica rustica]|uniref:Uncharacterized protein n=1 Tax=Hirundo rustica rustica TaxID=333673 RepID=A0A3M0LBA2_HIRRU|nr:hypothetical protein DUI87_00628 [Hirundo rustica rustica]
MGQQQLQMEGGVRICERKNPEDIKASGEEGAEKKNVPGTRVDFPLHPVVKTVVRQLYPSSTCGPQRSRDHLQSVEDPMMEQRQKQAVAPQEAHSGVSLLAGFVTLWENHAGAINGEL